MSNVSISLEVVVLAGFLAATLAFLIHEIYSLDVWWHLRIGRDILESGSIPDRDLYSVLGFDRPYHDSHWLFQVLLASAERSAGLVGVQLTMVVLWLVTLAMTYRATRSWVGPLVGGGLVFLVAMSAVERFLPRPEVITFLMLAAFYVLLQKWEREPLRALAPLIGLQIVWSNSHGLFVLGPFVVACYAMLSPWRGTARRQRELLEWLVCVVVVSVASLVTPFGASGWRYAWQLATQAGT